MAADHRGAAGRLDLERGPDHLLLAVPLDCRLDAPLTGRVELDGRRVDAVRSLVHPPERGRSLGPLDAVVAIQLEKPNVTFASTIGRFASSTIPTANRFCPTTSSEVAITSVGALGFDLAAGAGVGGGGGLLPPRRQTRP